MYDFKETSQNKQALDSWKKKKKKKKKGHCRVGTVLFQVRYFVSSFFASSFPKYIWTIKGAQVKSPYASRTRQRHTTTYSAVYIYILGLVGCVVRHQAVASKACLAETCRQKAACEMQKKNKEPKAHGLGCNMYARLFCL